MIKPTIQVCLTSLGANKDDFQKAISTKTALDKYFTIKIGQDIRADDIFESSSVSKRLASTQSALNEADIAMAYLGGFNSIELLSKIDELSVRPESVFVGMSDNTILTNALKCQTFYGPGFRNFVSTKADQESAQSLLQLYSSNYDGYSDLLSKRRLNVIQTGEVKAKIIGGNNYTFCLLQGTKYCPRLDRPFVLLMEGEDVLADKRYIWRDYIRNIDSIMLLPGAKQNLRGLIMAEFPASFKPSQKEIVAFVSSREYLQDKLVVYGAPFGHGDRPLYVPLGETVKISAFEKQLKISKI